MLLWHNSSVSMQEAAAVLLVSVGVWVVSPRATEHLSGTAEY